MCLNFNALIPYLITDKESKNILYRIFFYLILKLISITNVTIVLNYAFEFKL